MKQSILSLLLLVSFPAFAGGGNYEDSDPSAFCAFVGFILVIMLIGFIVFAIWDFFKMKTDPEYAERARIARAELKKRERGGY
ncbi:hypothetical protein HQ487_03620 [Candidatus Uhrbacteria bacterium]|nr:hypothetical protein [Candidatus Uhrbacteria bacterium]